MSAEEAKVRYLIVHLPGPQWRAGVAFQEQPGIEGQAFVITADMPFRSEDASALKTDPAPVVTKYFPRAEALLTATSALARSSAT